MLYSFKGFTTTPVVDLDQGIIRGTTSHWDPERDPRLLSGRRYNDIHVEWEARSLDLTHAQHAFRMAVLAYLEENR